MDEKSSVAWDKRIREWLEAEGFDVQEHPLPEGALWEYHVQVRGVVVRTVAIKERPALLVDCMVELGAEHQEALDALSPDEQEAFINNVALRLLGQDCDLQIRADQSGRVLQVYAAQHLYPENLTRQAYMDALRRTHRCGKLALVLAKYHLDPWESGRI